MKINYYKYMKKQHNNRINIIALGQNCMPRSVLTRWGIKKKKIFGELTYPFDIAVFETREITNLIKTDFKEFFYNLNYRSDRKIWVKEPDCIEFVHETNFGANDKEKLINKYIKRFDNFKQAMADDNPILFVQILGDCSDIENLYDELKKQRGDKPFKLAIIDTQDITQPILGINILKIKFPSDEYKQNWWKKEYYKSSEGIEFERKIVNFISNVIAKM